jgi:hypothetical protein
VKLLVALALCSFIALEQSSAQPTKSFSGLPSLAFVTPEQIDGYLSKLKTHNKRPLRELLASYGLKKRKTPPERGFD